MLSLSDICDRLSPRSLVGVYGLWSEYLLEAKGQDRGGSIVLGDCRASVFISGSLLSLDWPGGKGSNEQYPSRYPVSDESVSNDACCENKGLIVQRYSDVADRAFSAEGEWRGSSATRESNGCIVCC